MIDIRNIPPPLTQVERAPKPAARNEPSDMPATRAQTEALKIERRRNPDRRRRRGDQGPMDQRTGADRRRRTVDISV